MNITLTAEQLHAVEVLQQNRLVLFSGPPGSGKTTTLAHWLASKEPDGDRGETLYMAPTGKAAQRMTEAFSEADLDARAYTIHSSLAPKFNKSRHSYSGDSWYFDHDVDNPWHVSRVVVDEASMIDSFLMRSLMDAVPTGAQLVLCGDPHQLAPVGSGKPFLDMLHSGVVAHAQLTEIHRFAGRGAHVCQDIMAGRPPVFSKEIDLSPSAGPCGPENIVHLEKTTPEQIVDTLRELVKKIIIRGMDPIHDLQVICARNDAGAVSRASLNVIMQDLLNHDGFQIPGTRFRVKDKVMCLKNHDSVPRSLPDKRTGNGPVTMKLSPSARLANGESGEVAYVDQDCVLVKFPMRSGYHWFSQKKDSNLTLSYAITTHKSQGGGWPVVAYVIDKADFIDRSLTYTAISRFQLMCCTIGRMGELCRQIRGLKVKNRNTLLTKRLHGGMPTMSDDYMGVPNVTLLESNERFGLFRFEDFPDDDPHRIPWSVIHEDSVDRDGKTGTLVVETWFAIQKLQLEED